MNGLVELIQLLLGQRPICSLLFSISAPRIYRISRDAILVIRVDELRLSRCSFRQTDWLLYILFVRTLLAGNPSNFATLHTGRISVAMAVLDPRFASALILVTATLESEKSPTTHTIRLHESA